MTYDQIKASKEDLLKVDDVAEALHMHPDRLRQYAREGKLKFPIRESGNRILIGRVGFLNWWECKNAEPAPSDRDEYLKEIAERLADICWILTVMVGPEKLTQAMLLAKKWKEEMQ